MWVTNGLRSGLVFVLVKTDPDADPRYKGMTCFVAEKEPGVSENTGEWAGFTVPPPLKKMGYKGVESTELVFDGYRCPAENILGGEEAGLNKGFVQMMDALEVGRANVAARGVGIAQRALELALRYSQERKAFGKPIAQHQAIQFKLADMATQIEAARLLTRKAARLKDAGESSELEAGMAKLFASEMRALLRRGVLPHPRRLRLLQGVRDRAPVPRRAAAAHRRGHVGDPADGHRQEAPAAQQDLSAGAPPGRAADQIRLRVVTTNEDAKTLIEIAVERFLEEVPALAPLKLIFAVELKGRGDVQMYRVELAGPGKIDGHEGHRRGRPRPRPDAALVLQRHGEGGPHRRLARGLHVRPGEGERGAGDPQAHRARRGEAGRAPAPAPRAQLSRNDSGAPSRRAKRPARSAARSWPLSLAAAVGIDVARRRSTSCRRAAA